MVSKRTVMHLIILKTSLCRFILARSLSSPCRLRLILVAIHLDRPEQMRERELGELPLAVFLDVNLGHHKRIGDYVLTDCCLEINVLKEDGCVAKYASVDRVDGGLFVPDAPALDGR